MIDRHGMTLVRCPPNDNVAIAPQQGPTQLSRTAALIASRMDDVYTTSDVEPTTWTSEQLEDVVAALDGIADIAAREADRLRRCRGSMS